VHIETVREAANGKRERQCTRPVLSSVARCNTNSYCYSRRQKTIRRRTAGICDRNLVSFRRLHRSRTVAGALPLAADCTTPAAVIGT